MSIQNTYNSHVFPFQKLPLSKKDEEWRKACVDSIISRMWSSEAIEGRTKRERMAIAYDLYNGILDEKDIQYVTNPFKVEDGFPASIQNINIIKPHVDLLLGEEIRRPLNYVTIQTNEDVVSEIQAQAEELLMEYLQQDVENNALEKDKPLTIEEIEKYLKYDYKTSAERLASSTLEYLKEKLQLQNEFVKGFKDALIAGNEIYYVGIVNGEPYVERVDVLDCDYDKDPNVEFIEDGDWFCRVKYMTPYAIYDNFFDFISEEEFKDVLEKLPNSGRGRDVSYSPIIYRNVQDMTNLSSEDEFRMNILPVYHVQWRSFKKIYYLEKEDGTTEIVDENYALAANVKGLKSDWIPEIWEGYRIGQDIYIGIQPLQYQSQSMDDLTKPKLSYTGTVYNDTNTRSKSLVEIMKPLQYMYVILWYRLELALAKDKGRILNMDPTQIPKSMGISVEKWLHYLTALGINFVNPYEEGWDVPGRQGGKPAQFNQISSQDLSMTAVIADYIRLMDKIEDMLGRLSGVSQQRLGSIETRESVGNVQKSVTQSSFITEYLFYKHDQVKKRVLTNLINVAKYAWKESGKKKLHFVLGDARRVFMDINDDFLYSDYDVFITNSSESFEALQTLRTLVQPAMQNGATLSDAVLILTENNISEIKNKLADIDRERARREEEMQKAQQEAQERLLQMQLDKEAEKNRIMEEDSIRKAETAITVAEIQASAKMLDVDKNNDGVVDFKSQLEAERLRLEADFKEKKLQEEMRKNRENERLKEKQIKAKSSENPAKS